MSQPYGPQGHYQQFPPGQGGYPPPAGPQGYPQPGGYGPYGGPPKKSPLPWILAGIGALLVAGGVVLLIVLLGGDDEGGSGGSNAGGPGGSGGPVTEAAADTSTPEGAAQGVVAAINAKNAAGIVALTCEQMQPQMEIFALVLADIKSTPGLPADLQGKLGAVQVSAALDRVEPQSDTQATAYITITMTGLPPQAAQYGMEPSDTTDFPFQQQNGQWLLCGQM